MCKSDSLSPCPRIECAPGCCCLPGCLPCRGGAECCRRSWTSPHTVYLFGTTSLYVQTRCFSLQLTGVQLAGRGSSSITSCDAVPAAVPCRLAERTEVFPSRAARRVKPAVCSNVASALWSVTADGAMLSPRVTAWLVSFWRQGMDGQLTFGHN